MRYHNWILKQFRLEREEKVDEKVQRNAHILRFTSCAECDTVMPTMLALQKTSLQEREDFCSEDCHHVWHMRRLRQLMEV